MAGPFRAHFVEGLDIRDRPTLARLVGEIGLGCRDARRNLEGEADRPEALLQVMGLAGHDGRGPESEGFVRHFWPEGWKSGACDTI